MKARVLILLLIGLRLSVSFGQSDNSIQVKAFPGTTVGAKVGAAMASCPAGQSCILVLGASLSAYAAGTMPQLCAGCSLADYRGSKALIVDVSSFGAMPSSADNYTAIQAAVAFVNTQPAPHVELFFAPGTYYVNPATNKGSNTLASISANNVTVAGPGASITLASSGSKLNHQFSVASGTVYYWNYFVFTGNGDTIEDLTLNSNNMTTTETDEPSCVGPNGCFWATGIYGTGPAANLTIRNMRFLVIEGWPVLSSANNTQILSNYAEKSKGMVCAINSGCQILGNTSVESQDAPYAVNGSATTATRNFIVSNNLALDTTPGLNGAGIDVTGAADGIVSNNTISGMGNWCIQVDKTNGSYSHDAAGTYLPSRRISIIGNHCSGNNTYGGWPINAEILVGDAYNSNGAIPWTAGQTAADIFVQGNDITAYNPSGNDIGVAIGYGAQNVTVSNNNFWGCGTVASGTCGVTPMRVFDIGQTTNITVTNNHQDSAYAGTIHTTGPGPYEIFGNGPSMPWVAVGGNPYANPFSFYGDLKSNGNLIIPKAVNGYHGTSGTKVQLSDGSGPSGGLAKFAADGSVTNSRLVASRIPMAYNSVGAEVTNPHFVWDRVRLSEGQVTVNLSGSSVFTNNSSFRCLFVEESDSAVSNVVSYKAASGSAITIRSSSGTDANWVDYSCFGN